jgi:hypothetical protein
VTTAETSSEPPQPSLLEKKMNMTIGWSATLASPARRPYERNTAPPAYRAGLGVVPILDVGLT